MRAHRIRLEPNQAQRVFFARCAGVARVAYNWALARWKEQYTAGQKPNEAALRRELNALKKVEYPWMLEVPKTVPQQAIKNLGAAFQRFFRKQGKYPRFKRKYVRDSFRIDNGPAKVGEDAVRLNGNRIKVPKLGWVRMSEALRLCGQVKSAWVSREADEWFITLVVATATPSPPDHANVVGVDLGIKELAVCSNGQRFSNPSVLRMLLSRLRRLSKNLSRKKKGSNRRHKARSKLARLHQRIKNVRQDNLHKTTTAIAEAVGAGVVGLENLNVRRHAEESQARSGYLGCRHA